MASEQIVWSDIEKKFLAQSPSHIHDPSAFEEKIPTIEVTNIYDLGKIVSQRFMEWAHLNPSGVVALPTGRTPEFFIKTLEKYKAQWESSEVQDDLKGTSLALAGFPETKNLKFVMLDEFFPMPSTHRNSFCRYIRNYYVGLLDIASQNILTFDLVSEGAITSEELQLFDGPVVDIDLLTRDPVNEQEEAQKSVLVKVAAYCDSYETKIREWGGIGFFLGGIGPDGHIAFNQKDAPLDSLTRIVNFNYPSAAQSAGDLGGIEIARGKAALTIGLKTITANPSAVIIIMAAGEGKASIVREALEGERSPAHPASCLHGHPGARFYITQGAACHLTNRKYKTLLACSQTAALEWALSHLSGCTYPGGSSPALKANPPTSYRLLETYLYDQSLKLNIPVHTLTPAVLTSCPPSLTDELACRIIVSCASKRLKEKIESGIVSTQLSRGNSILHTAPHHDDIMLSYHAAMHDHLGRPPYSPGVARTSPSYPVPDLERSVDINVIAPLGEQINGNVNHFAYLTSGFHSVNEDFLSQQCEAVLQTVEGTIKQYFYHLSDRELLFIDICVYVGDITKNYDEIMTIFRHAFYQQNVSQLDHLEHVIFLRKVCEVWNISTTLPLIELAKAIKDRVLWVQDVYLPSHSPGDSIPRSCHCSHQTHLLFLSPERSNS
jgi:6-phosphogluconolactonase/glucosamine-6-phosphate isomerase/deaminase